MSVIVANNANNNDNNNDENNMKIISNNRSI